MTGETENGRSISVIRNCLPRKSCLAIGPGGGDAEHDVQRHGDGGGEQRQPDGRQRVGLDDRCQIGLPALLERFDEHRDQRQQQEGGEERQRDRDDEPLDERGIGRGRARLEARRAAEGRGVGVRDHGHQRDLPLERAVQACSALMMSSRTNETTSITAATAVAPA